MIRSFGESIYAVKISIPEVEMDQTNLLENMVKFNNRSRPKTKEDRDKKRNTFDITNAFYESQELTLNAFRSGIFPLNEFPINEKQRRGLKLLTPKQIFQRLPISLAEVKAGNTSEKLLNEIRKIIYSFYQAKQITKEVYNNIMN